MKKVILGLVLVSSVNVYANDITMPMSCYKDVKKEAQKFRDENYSNCRLNIPQVAVDLGAGKLSCIVYLKCPDYDYPAAIFIPASISVKGDKCVVTGKAHN